MEHFLPTVLDRLEAVWRSQGALIADHLMPGATSDHLDGLEARMGQPIPPELRAWWQWHDGVERLGPGTGIGPIGPGFWDFKSSIEAVEDRANQLATNPEWERGWLPVVRQDAYALFVDCHSVTPVGTVPVRSWDHTPMDPYTPAAGCFTLAVLIWTELLEQGVYHWNVEHRGWDLDQARLPRSLMNFGPL
jgi:hypothetical protein